MLSLWKSVLMVLWNLWAQGQDAPVRDLLASSCESCHPAEVSQWRQSRHAVAFSNGLFRAEFGVRRTAWCASCHAPAAHDPRTVADDDVLAMQGVGCMSCHLGPQGRLVSRHKASNSPHKTVASKTFGDAEFCGGCHEFKFPVMGDDGMPIGFQDLAMQETVSQFANTPTARQGDDCRSCHMNPAGGMHRFVGSHDLPTLQSALQWDICAGSGGLRVEIANIGAAHSVPTGGVNRHIVLRMWQSGAPEAMVEHFIGRRFEGDDDGDKRLVVDSTLAAGARRTFTASLATMAPQAEEPVNVELRYIYPLDEFAELAPGTRRFATVFSERKAVFEFETCAEQ